MRFGAAVLLMLAALGRTPRTREAWRQAALDALCGCIDDRRLVLPGEMQGTREMPLLASDLAEHPGRSQPLLLALEIHSSEHAALSAYLEGDGSAAAREQLRQRPYWAVPQERNDGRRSEGMLDLVERARQLRAQGRDMAILPFDVANGVSSKSRRRDRSMASYLRKAWLALPRCRAAACWW